MSSTYQIEAEITRRTRNKESLPPMVYNFEDVAQVASLYWRIPSDAMRQFGREFMPKGIHNPRDIARDPVKFPPVFLDAPGIYDYATETRTPGVIGAFLPVDKGNDVREPKYTPAIARAEDIASRMAHRGWFVPASGTTAVTREEVAAALKMLEVTYEKQFQLGEDLWRKSHRRKDVITTAYTAAEYFGRKTEWTDALGEKTVCESCDRQIPLNRAVCPECKAVLDWKKARKFNLVSRAEYDAHLEEEAAEAEPVKRGPGRPPKVQEPEL
jgi:hypothetical protein